MRSNLTLDHHPLKDAQATRRYFAKFESILGHLSDVAKLNAKERLISKQEAAIIGGYLHALGGTFTALSYKHLMAGRVSDLLPNTLNIDAQDSGFPVYQELLQMANDALQADRHLANSHSPDRIKKDMVRHMLSDLSAPTKLQYAMSQRLYYQHLAQGPIFWAQNHPIAEWIKDGDRRTYLLHWAGFDSQQNLPMIYVMEVEDSGRTRLPRDERRWPAVQSHLMAQMMGSLNLETLAKGLDRDFDDLHPKRLRRTFIGPMFSHAYTEQTGAIRDILAEASGAKGLDWALSWTVETLVSKDVEKEKSGWFSSVDREVFDIKMHRNPFGQGTGVTESRQAVILPQRAYQVLEERHAASFKDTRKYVVSPRGKVMSQR